MPLRRKVRPGPGTEEEIRVVGKDAQQVRAVIQYLLISWLSALQFIGPLGVQAGIKDIVQCRRPPRSVIAIRSADFVLQGARQKTERIGCPIFSRFVLGYVRHGNWLLAAGPNAIGANLPGHNTSSRILSDGVETPSGHALEGLPAPVGCVETCSGSPVLCRIDGIGIGSVAVICGIAVGQDGAD